MAGWYLALYIVLLCGTMTTGTVTLNNNTYEGLEIVIHDSVSEDPDLIDRIKEIFTEASAVLYTATKYRAYFHAISIIIPQNWTSITVDSTTASTDTSSEYILVKPPARDIGDNPYVRGNLVCGRPGWYMHLTPGFIQSTNGQYGPHGKVIVHEWGHLRWGVFDEYASIKRRDYNQYYYEFYLRNGLNQPVTCSSQVQGRAEIIENASGTCDLKSAVIDHRCRFTPNDGDTLTRSSLMGSQWLSSLTDFCDDPEDESVEVDLRHNAEAPNLQNRLCNGKSIWAVLREHGDFNNNNNPADPPITDTNPQFTIIRRSVKLRVFVFDVSGSMLGDKIAEQAKAARTVIDTSVETGSYLGLVQFSHYAAKLVGLTEVNNNETRVYIKNAVPTYAGGGTRIYNGLSLAVSMIQNNTHNLPTHGAEIILLSDGMSDPYLSITSTLQDLGIKVHTIAITNAADPNMTQLASDTGGKSFTYLQTSQISFADVFSAAAQSSNAGSPTSEKVFGNSYTINVNNDPVSGSFIIDDGLGKETTVVVLLSSDQTVTLSVTDPNMSVYSTTGTAVDILSLVLNAGQQVQTGNYTFNVIFPSSFSGTAEVIVTSLPISADAEVIQVTSTLLNTTIDFNDTTTDNAVYATVVKGQTPVLNATVTLVLAATSTFTPITIRLWDNGTGPDAVQDDGTYSAFLLKQYFTANSNYNLKIRVVGNELTAVYTLAGYTNRASSMTGTSVTEVTSEPVGAFERQSVTDQITVANFVTNPADTTPPARITDLRIEGITFGQDNVTYIFSWTAVGSDLDNGTAQEYEMRFDSDISKLRNNFTLTQEVPTTLPQPGVSGVTETINITFSVSHCNGTCHVAIRARDENNLNGSVSNTITIDIVFTYITDRDTNANVSTNLAGNTDANNSRTGKVLIAVLVAVGVVIILIITLIVIVYKYHHNEKPTKTSPFNSSTGADPETGSQDNISYRSTVPLTRNPFRMAREMFVGLPLMDYGLDTKLPPGTTQTVVEKFKANEENHLEDNPPSYEASIQADRKAAEVNKMSFLNESRSNIEVMDLSDDEVESVKVFAVQNPSAIFKRAHKQFEAIQLDQQDEINDTDLIEPANELKEDDNERLDEPLSTSVDDFGVNKTENPETESQCDLNVSEEQLDTALIKPTKEPNVDDNEGLEPQSNPVDDFWVNTTDDHESESQWVLNVSEEQLEKKEDGNGQKVTKTDDKNVKDEMTIPILPQSDNIDVRKSLKRSLSQMKGAHETTSPCVE